MPSPNNCAIIAAAGSGKTATVIDEALAVASGRVLILTYTNENQRQIIARIEKRMGTMPPHVAVMGWFTFLIHEGARPYQSVMTGSVGRIGSLNFVGSKHKFAKRNSLGYYLDRHDDMYRDGVSDFVCRADVESAGAVVRRLEAIYSHILIDEVQDLVGYDLDLLDLLFASSISVTVVGDPRQHTFSTNLSRRNKKYQGPGLLDWLAERTEVCTLEVRHESWRCSQELCDFADALFPNLPATKSLNRDSVEHRGVFVIPRAEVESYVASWDPVVLRESKRYDTCGLPAMNIGVAKGSTFDRVLLFSTSTMLAYVEGGDLSELKTKDRLYVAVTRARYSATFVRP